MIRSFQIFLVIFATACLVESKEGFYCIPSVKSTWIYVEKKSDVVIVVVRNPMGYQFMQQFDGPTAPSSLPFQKMQFEDLKGLGDEFVLTWPSSRCDYDNKEKTLFCNGAASQQTSGIAAYGFTTIQITEKYKLDTYQKNRYRINFGKDGNTYFTSLDFFVSSCANLKADSQNLKMGSQND